MVTTEQRQQPSALGSGGRKLMIGLTVWVLLQLPRLVAVLLIASVGNGEDAPAWMYPAVLDVVVAVLAPFVALALWRWRGFWTWTFAVTYLVVSIVDHVGFFTTYAQVGAPIAFEGMTPPGGAEVVPAIQTAIDVVFVFLLARGKELFFKVAQPSA